MAKFVTRHPNSSQMVLISSQKFIMWFNGGIFASIENDNINN